MRPSLRLERRLWAEGHVVAGADEVGRGAWAGPLVAAAVILPHGFLGKALSGLKDSKQLAPKKRERFYLALVKIAAFAIGVVDVDELDTIGVGEANRVAIRRALAALTPRPTYALIDAFTISGAVCPTEGIAKGDERVCSIAAASVIAKVLRDKSMVALHARDPQYRFDLHKGYGTAVHQKQLVRYGPSRFHRKSFAPIHDMIE